LGDANFLSFGPFRSPSKRILALTVAAMIVASSGSAFGATTSSSNSGTFRYAFNNYAGLSAYTIVYSYPPTAVSGKEMNVTLLLEVNQLSHLKSYLLAYEFKTTVYLSNNRVIMGKVDGPLTVPLYAGSHWGPVNVTIPINDSAAGIAPGQAVSGNVSIGLIADVWYDLSPNGWHYPESNATEVGGVTLTSPGASVSAYEGYIGVGALVAVGVVAVLVILRKRGSVAGHPLPP
jgi:hypothetical protein